MDKASIIGILIGVAALGFVVFEVSHGNLLMFYSLEGVLMVGCGSVSVVFIAMPMEKLKQVPGYIKTFLFQKGMSANEVIQTVQSLSDKARRDGILALEPEIAKIKDPFLAAGLKMAIDGVEPASIEATLRMEILAMQDRHKAGKKFFDLIKLYGPGYGLVGTLVGQVGMFGQLASADIGALGHALAIAVVATMYGAIVANAIAGPIGDKLGIKSGEEILNREMMVQAILSVQAGDNPRVTLDKMLAFIPSVRRDPFRAAA
ncbi:MAG: MotA/TolQ/ExbB proton channel family protein [Phycisphaerae bacterium]|nr:MotA/TolQ/ExbB proton channel family protein [Phycisphaerae bacterium]MBN8598184.1 MotA/TolQ/ExbB proton channel family protein [Planctomycetota bacterium]